MNIANVRILRMAVATGISMYVSQVGNWQMSFIAPIFTMFILALPLPALKLSGGIKFALVFIGSIYAALLLLPIVVYYHIAGVLLIALALFLSFYYTARGGSAILGTFVTVGITLVTAIGSVSIDMVLALVGGLNIGIIVGVLFAWLGHLLMPDSLATPAESPAVAPAAAVATEPDNVQARKSAYRSLLIVMPILIWFLLSSSSASYVVVMIKVASMGQQASLNLTRRAAKTMLMSILIGGIAAVVGWQILSVYPSLVLYTLLIVLTGLIFGRRIFAGPGAHPSSAVWSDAYLTMMIILAPAVLDGQTGGSAGAAFWSRLILLIGASLYGIAAVYIFDLLNSDPASTADAQEA